MRPRPHLKSGRPSERTSLGVLTLFTMTKRVPKNLETYRKKRNFEVTSEPAPTPVDDTLSGERPSFMVHKHDASRLHYDVRLEMDGALASWAVPKGPSYDPKTRRMAVQTEDHPIEYGKFEGRIPDGEYGGGDSLIWDRGTYDTIPPGQASAQRKKGHLDIQMQGEKLKGRWHLVRTRPGESGQAQWLMFKGKDELASETYDVVTERPESVVSGRRVTRGPVTKKKLYAPHATPAALLERVWPPMKATLSSPQSASDRNWVYEVKYDGYRALAAVVNGRIAFQSRNQLDFESRFPDIARALKRMHIGEAVLDGEVVAVDPSGRSNFQSIQGEASEHRFYVFDLLWLDGEDLRSRPLEERRDLLVSVLSNVPPPLFLSERVEEEVERAMEIAKARSWEGLIAKEKGSHYEGRRSSAWLKLKLNQAQEVVIVGYTPIKNGAKEVGALLVGVRDGDHYTYAGKVGTGFSSAQRRELKKKLDAISVDGPLVKEVPRMRAATWVQPRFVAQVAFTEWTRDGKLRHPVFHGLREDKSAEQVVREVAKEVRGQRSAPRKKAARTARAAPTKAPSKAKVKARVAASTPDVPADEYKLTSADRVLFPKSGYTKASVYKYYSDIAALMLPTLQGRPLAFQIYPEGIQKAGVFRQGLDRMGAKDWVTRAKVTVEGGRVIEHVVVDKKATLLWLANRSALTLHMWSSRLPELGSPNWVLFDLDPGEKTTWPQLIRVAMTLRGMLEHLCLQSVPKTSGKRGIHVFVPIAKGHTHADALEFAVAVTQTMEKGLGDIATTERMKDKRHGRLYLDAFQNGEGKTVVAPYTIRAIEGAPVSAPLQWSEVTEKLDPLRFTIKTLHKRVQKLGDLFEPALAGKQRLPRFPSR